jgi:hypothetical protein
MRTDVHISLIISYLISWIFIGNYVLLNLFLAILIEGFTNKPKKDEDDIFFGEEDIEQKGIRLKKKYDREARLKLEEDLELLRMMDALNLETQNTDFSR